MDELERLKADYLRLEKEQAEISARLASQIEENHALSAELEETNKGVLALYAELDTKAQELQEISELKSRFLSYMSHEFRAPLGSIRSIARILLDRLDGPLTEEQEKQVKFISDASVELTQMVDDLLDLAKIEAGRINVSAAWFELVDFFAALRGMFRPILTGAVTLIFDEPVNVPPLYTDDTKLSQVIRNFISNALKFTSEGEVRVSARGVGQDMVRFSVSDTGIGIAKEFHEAIFEDFVQVDSPIQKRLRGTGLGLSVSKKMAHLLGGEVSVESTPGVGSTFSVTIPARYSGEGQEEEAGSPREPGRGHV